MKFNPEEIKEATKADFDAAWNSGKKYVAQTGINEKFPRVSLKFGKPHPVFDTIQRLRDAYMHLGFEEFMNPIIVEDRDNGMVYFLKHNHWNTSSSIKKLLEKKAEKIERKK